MLIQSTSSLSPPVGDNGEVQGEATAKIHHSSLQNHKTHIYSVINVFLLAFPLKVIIGKIIRDKGTTQLCMSCYFTDLFQTEGCLLNKRVTYWMRDVNQGCLFISSNWCHVLFYVWLWKSTTDENEKNSVYIAHQQRKLETHLLLCESSFQ